MKLGISFDTCQEAEEVIHYNFIAGMWINKATFRSFNLSTQIHLSKQGYSVERIDSFLPLIKKAKNWVFQNVQPINTIFTKADLMQWNELYIICDEIFWFEKSLRAKYKLN